MWGAIEHLGRDDRTRGYLRDAWSPADLELGSGSARRPPGGVSTCARTATATCGPGGATRRSGRAWSRAATSTRSGRAAPSTAPSASCRPSPPSTCCGPAASSPAGRSGSPASPTRRAPGSGSPCVGSRLLTGVLDPDRARGLTDDEGDTLAEVLRRAGRDPRRAGPRRRDPAARSACSWSSTSSRGRAWSTWTRRSGVAAAIWPHGRWRFDFRGRGQPRGHHPAGGPRRPDAAVRPDRAGRPRGRRAARRGGHLRQGPRVDPNNANAVPGLVTAWLDARGGRGGRGPGAGRRAGRSPAPRCSAESWTPVVDFDVVLRERIGRGACGGTRPVAADRGRTRRRDPGVRGRAQRDGVRSQPDGRVPLPGRARRARPTATRGSSRSPTVAGGAVRD